MTFLVNCSTTILVLLTPGELALRPGLRLRLRLSEDTRRPRGLRELDLLSRL